VAKKKISGDVFVATASELGWTTRDAELAWRRLAGKARRTNFGPSQVHLALAEEIKLSRLVDIINSGRSQFQNMSDETWLLMRDTIEELS